jgi:hypothetical protein
MVTAEILPVGDLVIHGDAESNEIAILFANDRIRIESLDDNTVINYGIPTEFDPQALTGDLRIHLYQGSNVVRVGGEAHETDAPTGGDSGGDSHDEPRLFVPGDLLVFGGNDDDSMSISFVEIGGRLRVDSGPGNDTINVGRGPGFGHSDHGDDHGDDPGGAPDPGGSTGMGGGGTTGCGDSGSMGPPPDVQIGEDLRIMTGPGDDAVKIAFAAIAEGVRVQAGPGLDTVVTGRGPIRGVHGPGGDGGCGDTDHDGGDCNHDGGSGHPEGDGGCGGGGGGGDGGSGGSPASHRPVDVRIGQDLRVDLGPEDDFVMLRNSKVNGDLEIHALPGDDAIGTQNLKVHGNATITATEGDHRVAILESTFRGMLEIDTGAGNDVIVVANSVIDGPFRVDMRGGADTLILASTSFLVPAQLSGGDGSDILVQADIALPPSASSFEQYDLDAAILDAVLEEIDERFGGFLQGDHQII